MKIGQTIAFTEYQTNHGPRMGTIEKCWYNYGILKTVLVKMHKLADGKFSHYDGAEFRSYLVKNLKDYAVIG